MKDELNILIACEFSGVVREAFRAKGHNAWSCDLVVSDKGPEHHIMGDVLHVLQGMLCDKWEWDMLIAFPPCTYLCNSGVRWLYNKDGSRNESRWFKMFQAAHFFDLLLLSSIPKIAVENPIMHGHAKRIFGREPDQTIQPWQFGEDASKATCLWLKDLPKLEPTKIIRRKRYANQTPSGQNKLGPSADRARLRSITYQGIADAIAEQWG